MKKLMVMLGAAAMAFGLFADAQPYAMSFETQTEGVTDLTWTPGSGWSGLTGPLTLKTGARTLPYTGSTYDAESNPTGRRDSMFNGLAANNNWLDLSTGSDALTLEIGTGNKVVDQLVKFTGFEEAPEVTDGKIAVWMSEFPDESDGADEDATTTNLFVSCARVTAGGVEQVNIQIDGDYELDKWYHLTIFSIEDIYDNAGKSRAGFKVFIDGDQAVAAEGQDADTIVYDAALMTDDAKTLMAKGALFPAIDDETVALASVSYKGIGAIDDIIVDENGPAFRTDAALNITLAPNVILTATKDDLERTLLESGVLNLEPGTWTFSFSAADSYVIDPPVAPRQVEVAGDTEMDLSDIKAGEIVATVSDGVAEFDYASLSNALVKVQELEVSGEEVQVTISKTVTEEIEGAGTLGFDAGTVIGVNSEDAVGTWLIMGNARLGANIAEGKTVIVMANPETTVGGALTYAGEVAGKLQAATLSKLGDGGIIKIAVGGAITVGTQIPDCQNFFEVPDNYEVDEAYNEADETWTYTAVQSAPETFTVTVEASNATLLTNDFPVVGSSFTAEAGTVFALTAVAATGYKDATIKIDEIEVSSLTLEKDVTIVVGATAKAYVLNATAKANTSLAKDPAKDTYALGEVVTLTASIADSSNYEWDSIPTDWTSPDEGVTYTLTYTILDQDEAEGNVVETPTAKAKQTEPDRPSDINGGSQAQKDAYDDWVKNKAGGVTQPTAAGNIDRFIMNVPAATTDAELAAIAETELKAAVDAGALEKLIAGQEPDLTALKARYPQATIQFVEVNEGGLTKTANSNFWRLKFSFTAAND